MSYPAIIPGQMTLADVLAPVVTVTRRCYGAPAAWRVDYADGRAIRLERGDRSGYYRVNGGPQELAPRWDAVLNLHDSND